VLPAAARHQEHSARIVVRSLHATVLVGFVLALAIALVAPVGVQFVYGSDFDDSVSALWLLLPGCVLIAAAAVLTGGLYALNRPFASALAQVPGICVTVVGLLLFLESGGINAAAIVSSVSYATIFMAALVLYRRASGLSWRDLVLTAGDLGSLVTAPVRFVGTRRSVTVPDRRLR
jgi:O-antigen/teichoic acid export membrane protein